MVPAMTEKERVFIGGIELEAALTSGGLGTMCETYEGRVHRLDYKTLRYPGHFDQMHFLFDELDLRDQRELVGKILVDSKPPVNDDVVYIHAAVEGARTATPFRENYVRGYKPLEISGRVWRAISWTTAASAVGVVELVADGPLPQPDSSSRKTSRSSSSSRHRPGATSPSRERSDMTDIAIRTQDILDRLGAGDPFVADGDLAVPVADRRREIGRLRSHTADEAADVIGRAQSAFEQWRSVPAPVRGQFVRELGELLREHKDDLGALVSIEAGKIVSEGLGEVQEMIDICDLAVGLSRQLHGLTIATERPGHRMMEQWHPLGVVGVISAFNFPVAVWSWNAALAFVCGDAVVWKPSEKTLLTALGCQALVG